MSDVIREKTWEEQIDDMSKAKPKTLEQEIREILLDEDYQIPLLLMNNIVSALTTLIENRERELNKEINFLKSCIELNTKSSTH
jgi:hypothetical protein